MADKRPLTLSANGIKELLQPSNSLDIGGYTLPNVAGDSGNYLVMGASNSEWKELNNAYEKTGWDGSVFSEVTITFTDGTRTVAITPTGASASYYIGGIKYTFTTEQSVVIDDTEGLWYVYFDGITLTASQVEWTYDETRCPVMNLYWDATNNVNIGWQSDLHSWLMQQRLHQYLHDTLKTRFDEGLGVAEATTSTVNVAIGKLFDEDVQVDITDEVGSGWWDQVLSPLTSPIYYREGVGVWRKIAASTSLCYLDTNVPQVNIFSGTWQWSPVTTNRYFAYWVVASSDNQYPVYIVPGQESADKLSDTIAGNLLADMDFGGLPTAEHKVIARLILRRKGGSPYYEITQIDDYRYAKDENAGAGTTVSDHGGLTGLADDDHAQYHNDARATTWIDAGFNTTGDIKSNADAAKHYFGELDVYSIQWNGGNAVHTILAGAFNFDGGAIRLPTFTTTQRDALSPVEGMIIYNSTTLSVEKYEDTVLSAGKYALPTGGSPEDFLKRTALGYEWTTTFTSVLTVGGLSSSTNIDITSYTKGLVLGSSSNYGIKWDGSNAKHVIDVTAAFEFDGGAIRLPNVTTTERNALSAVNGMSIYNTTDDEFQMYEDGSWVQKAKVITSFLSLYIKITGNDSTGDGSSGTPWLTIDKALSVVSEWVLLAAVTIYIEKGDYTTTSQLNIRHFNGNKISIIGDSVEEELTMSASGGSAGTYWYTFDTTNTDDYTVGDFSLNYSASGGSDSDNTLGVLECISKVNGVSITLQSSVTATQATGAVIAKIVTPQVQWIRPVYINSSLLLLEGIQLQYNAPSTLFYLINLHSSGGGEVTIRNTNVINTNASRYGTCRSASSYLLSVTKCGGFKLNHGWFADGVIAATQTCMNSCVYGYRAYGGSAYVSHVWIALLDNTIALRAELMGMVNNGGGTRVFVGNADDASPNVGSQGNQFGYIST